MTDSRTSSAITMTSALPTRIGTQLGDDETADAIRITVAGAGLMLGRGEDGTPYLARMFDHEPRRFVLIGDPALAQTLCFRSLAVNARILIQTQRPGAWETFIRMASGSTGAIESTSKVRSASAGTAAHPFLLLVDSDSGLASTREPEGGWSTVVTAVESISVWNSDLLARVDAVLVGRVDAAVVSALREALGIDEDQVGQLRQLEVGSIAIITRGSLQIVQLALTDTEKWLQRGFIG